ncbi:MAG: enoyl-CoA hydratase/isomerase family protein [Deltaproteobacteria bacterium]|nr:enoyl-CoA hydratase/isomerase family protein [Deltaproteobacteria bacterium]
MSSAAVSPPVADVTTRDDGRVRVVTMYRPSSRNGLTLDMTTEIADAIDAAAKDDAVRALVLWGEGGAFCSGLDLKAAVAVGAGQSAPEQIRERMKRHFHRMIRSVRACEKPVIALVDGPAAGFGCDLALACDLRVVSQRARFGEIFVKRGLIPDGGGSFTLPRLIGLGRALELMMTGDIIDSAEAHRLGIANKVVPDADILAAGLAFAHKIAAGPPLVLRLVKQLCYGAQDASFDQALDAEVEGQIKCLNSADFIEGMTAFFAKRPPEFSGK